MYASPSDNYWIVGDQDPTVRWSSAQVLYVADSDSTYTAWVASGFDTCIIATEQELADLLNTTYPAGSPIPAPYVDTSSGPISVSLIQATTLLSALRELGDLLDGIEHIEIHEGEAPPSAEQLPDEPGIGLLAGADTTGQIIVPAGVYKMLVFGQAAGGASGSCSAATAQVGGAAGAGETRLAVLKVNPGDALDYTIGGAGIASGGNANDLLIGGSPAPAPVVKSNSISDTVNNGTGVATLTFPVALPLGIVAGDLLMLFIRTTAGLLTTPAGWTLLGHVEMPTFTGGFWCFYKVATGAEGASVTVTSSVATGWYNIGYCITGHDVPAYAPLIAAASAGTNNKPNPPSLNASALTGVNKLWIAAAAASNSVAAGQILSGLPSGFHSPWGPIYPQTYDIASQYESNVATLDPTNYIANGSASSTSWVAFTVAIKAAKPTALLLCKGGTGGGNATGGTNGTSGTTPVGSGGVRIPPTALPYGNSTAGGCFSFGGSSLFGLGAINHAASTMVGLTPAGPGGGGSAPGNGTGGTARAGANGSPGMILVIGFGQ